MTPSPPIREDGCDHASHPLRSEDLREWVVEWQGRTRKCFVWAPPQPKEPLPLVLVLHGAGTDALSMLDFTGFADKAREEGFAVAFPQGTGRLPAALSWNAGGNFVYAARHRIDDVGYLTELVRQLSDAYPIDRSRVCGCGMSNGGAMCYRLAAERPGVLAVMASVAGCLPAPLEPIPTPLPVLHIHGTRDRVVPFDRGRSAGGVGSLPTLSVAASLDMGRPEHGSGFFRSLPTLSVAATLDPWIRANRCSDIPEVTSLSPVVDDGTSVECTTFPDGVDGNEVVLYSVRGGGHTWPGRVSSFDRLGKVSRNLDATDVIWSFFRKHLGLVKAAN